MAVFLTGIIVRKIPVEMSSPICEFPYAQRLQVFWQGRLWGECLGIQWPHLEKVRREPGNTEARAKLANVKKRLDNSIVAVAWAPPAPGVTDAAGSITPAPAGAKDGNGTDAPTQLAAGKKLRKIDLALATLAQHSDWTTKKIAEHVGCRRDYLEKSLRFRAAREAQKPQGRKASRNLRTGELEVEVDG
jgi:hypothetical protein